MARGMLYWYAGVAIAGSSALGQAIPGIPFEVDRSQIRQIYVNEYGEPTAPYADRAIGTVHDGLNGPSAPLCGIFLNQAAAPQPLVNFLEDLNFTPGPWATTTNNVVRVFTVSVGNSATSGTINFDFRMRFWNPENVDFTRNPMITAGAVPLRELIFPVRNLGPGLFNFTFNLTAASQFTVPGNRVFFQGEALQPGSSTAYYTGTQVPFWAVNPNGFVAQRGGSSNSMGFDRNRDGNFEGVATPGNTLEHSALVFPAGGQCAGTNIHYPMVVQGDLPAAPPATFTDLGTLADIDTSLSLNVPANGAAWIRFRLPTSVTDAARRFLDFDCEGSTISDTDLALFTDAGAIVATDSDDGSGALGHLSFGIGRRAASANGGRQFDGSDGELSSLEPNYWLVVTTGPTLFSTGFNTLNSGPGGAVVLNARSNVQSGALAASVPPLDENVAGAFGDITYPGQQGLATTPEPRQIMWYTLNVCEDVTSSNGRYLDVDFSASDQLGDSQAFLFNSVGLVVATSDNADADGSIPFYAAPQFSFGHQGMPRAPVNPDAIAFDGQDGDLSSGVYYLAVGFAPVVPLSTVDRWHLRVSGDDSRLVRADVYTNITGACGCFAPQVITNPAPVTACVGASATLLATGVGLPAPSFQWRKNAVDIPGATSASLLLPSLSGSDSGTYDCVLINSCGTATTLPAAVTVNTPPILATQPLPQTRCEGQSATFSVTASGNPSPTYQWRLNGFALPGATASTLMVSPVTPASAGGYDCVVTNVCGTVTSANATLTVTNLPGVITYPLDASTCPTGGASFNVSSDGVPRTYRWQRESSPGSDQFLNLANGSTSAWDGGIGGALAFGTNTPTLIIVADTANAKTLTHRHAIRYRCLIGNSCGSVPSIAAQLTVCVADSDDGSSTGACDGGVTIDDLLYYLRAFESGDPNTDVDDGSGTGTPDGGVTIDDLLYYLQRFEAGC